MKVLTELRSPLLARIPDPGRRDGGKLMREDKAQRSAMKRCSFSISQNPVRSPNVSYPLSLVLVLGKLLNQLVGAFSTLKVVIFLSWLLLFYFKQRTFCHCSLRRFVPDHKFQFYNYGDSSLLDKERGLLFILSSFPFIFSSNCYFPIILRRAFIYFIWVGITMIMELK